MNLIGKIQKLSTHTSEGYSAPHKPLYILALASFLQEGCARLIPHGEVKRKLVPALKRFGAKSANYIYPIWYLPNDELSVIEPSDPSVYELRSENKEPTVASLTKVHAQVGFQEDDYFLLKGDSIVFDQIVHYLLDAYFPSSLHGEILAHFGIQLPARMVDSKDCSLDFRPAVLRAYNHRCAISGYGAGGENGSNKTIALGLEASGIKWLTAGGKYIVSNAIAMTSLHCRLFNLGVFTITSEYKVLVTESDFRILQPEWGLESGRDIELPSIPEDQPDLDMLEWHRSHIFKI